MNREEQLAKNTFIIALGTFLPRLVSFITLPILTGYLTQEEYGTYDLITVLVSLILPTATLQLKSAAFRFLIDARKNTEQQKSIISNIIIVSCLISVPVLAIFYFCIRSLGTPLIRILICIYLFSDMYNSTLRQIARGLSKNFFYSVSAIISSVGRAVIVILMVWYFRSGLIGTVLALIVSELISVIYLSAEIHISQFVKMDQLSTSELKEMLNYSWPMVPNELSMWVMRVSDRFVVTAFMGLAANAVYSVANKIPSIISLAQNAFTLAWQENATVSSSDEDVADYYSSMFDVMLRLQAGVFGLVLCATPVLFLFLIRGDYGSAYIQMPILCLAIFYSSMATFLGGIYVARKKSKDVGITTIVSAFINIIVDLALIQNIGLFAASGSTLISYICLLFYRMHDVKKLVDIRFNVKEFIGINVLLCFEMLLFYINSLSSNIINAVICIIASILLNWSLIKSLYKRAISFLNKRMKK